MLDAAHGVAESSIRGGKRAHIGRVESKGAHAAFARHLGRRRQIPAARPDVRQGSRRSSAEARSRHDSNRSNECREEMQASRQTGIYN